MKVIAFTGLPGSGKSEAVNVAKEMGIKVVRMGDEIRKEARKMGLELNDKNLGKIADEMRREHGMDIWARRCLPEIKNDMVIIDGIRNIEEVELFRQHIKNFILIAIHASPNTRYERMMKRGREDDSLSEEDLKERDERELRWGIGNAVAMADIVVANEGSLDEFRKKIKKILEGN
ncbi:MAG: dephospho-CoA kinase [Thermoplasmata archaeon]|nr:MAG: dephospho-CoA kinase [Thermoplasmata archaeon]